MKKKCFLLLLLTVLIYREYALRKIDKEIDEFDRQMKQMKAEQNIPRKK